MNAKAFCPGHVTGFFQICEGADPLSTGSRGAGLCLTRGAISEVKVEAAERQGIVIYVDRRKAGADTTRVAIMQLIGNEKLRVTVDTILDLPQSQGFGMSAAGALSASIALADMLGRTRQRAFEAAHIAEIQCSTGLGDVSAVWKGGITIRKRAGLPPAGEVIRIDGTPEVVLAVVGPKLFTKDVLTDPVKQSAINRSGARRVNELLEDATLDRLMDLSSSFAVESGLASDTIMQAMIAAGKRGLASMAMLGNSVFAIGDARGQSEALKEFGDVWRCGVSAEGPRVL